MKQAEILRNKVIDPICGMEVDPNKSNLAAIHKGCKYYFCAEACRSAFEGDPEKYLDPKSRKRIGWWGRYLQRLERATAGKSMTCH
jgi:YHS domain-containing protein